MELLASLLVFLLVTAGAAAIGVRLWLRPQAALNRLRDSRPNPTRILPRHPTLGLNDLLARIGSILPASPKDAGVLRARLVRCGLRSPSALKLVYGIKLTLALSLPCALSLIAATSPVNPGRKLVLLAGAGLVGYFAPNRYFRARARRRQRKIKRAVPNALDLLVVCVESGLGLDQAIMQCAKELEQSYPDLSQEFAFVNLELRAGKRRAEALRNMADRTGLDELRKLTTVLIQSDRFGTSVAQTLRTYSDYMRTAARQAAEEKASKLGVKLVFPIFFCILPCLFVVTVGPVIVKIFRELIPMMKSF